MVEDLRMDALGDRDRTLAKPDFTTLGNKRGPFA